MRSTYGIATYILLLPGVLLSQQIFDELDVVDGPNPTLRYGFFTEPSGQVQMGRYYFIDDGSRLQIMLAPYGKTVIELPVRNFDRDNGLLELGWEGLPERVCRLERQNATIFLGNCIEAFAVMPIAIRIEDERDVEWTGAYFAVSATDVAIVERAREIMVEQEQRNVNDDRNCDDDLDAGQFSIFCALYLASTEIDGVYRHRRPAMLAVREELRRRYPGQYLHTLRDINNNAELSDRSLTEALDSARDRLISEIGSPR